MISISVCMIVKNEEIVIERCLNCIKDIADEIIIVDTGSTDSTKEIAKKYTDKIFDFKWIDNFAAARNFSFSKASKDYVMWLDADDIINEKNIEAFKLLKKELAPSVDLVMMKYDVAFDSKDNPTFTYYRERLLKRSNNYKWVGEIHEVITPFGNVIHSDISISHKKITTNEPQRNLKIFRRMIEEGKTLEPRQKYYYARELYYNEYFDDAVKLFNEYLNEGKGWIENNISACKDLALCYYSMNENEKALNSLFRSFNYDVPRAEMCCEIGKHFFDKSMFEVAIFWYKIAASRKPNEKSGAFLLIDCYGFIPNIQLCVCYDRIGNYKKAEEYNEKAGSYKPDDISYLKNKEYFQSKK